PDIDRSFAATPPDRKFSGRIDHADEIFAVSDALLQELADRIKAAQAIGRPVVVATRSPAWADAVAAALSDMRVDYRRPVTEPEVGESVGHGGVTIVDVVRYTGMAIPIGGDPDALAQLLVDVGPLPPSDDSRWSPYMSARLDAVAATDRRRQE